MHTIVHSTQSHSNIKTYIFPLSWQPSADVDSQVQIYEKTTKEVVSIAEFL